jgi:hypothetical protein
MARERKYISMDREAAEFTEREVLMSGVDDWVDMLEVVSFVREATSGLDEAGALPLAIEVVKRLMHQGLVQVGDVGNEGFTPWSGSTSAVERRLDEAATTVTFPLRFSDVCWIQNTAAGHERGNALLDSTGAGNDRKDPWTGGGADGTGGRASAAADPGKFDVLRE